MPTCFSIYPTLQLSTFNMEGTISASEVKDCFATYTHHSDFDPSYPLVMDARRVDEVEATFSEILLAATAVLPRILMLSPGTPAALIANKPHVLSTAKMLEEVLSFLSQIRLRVVTSVPEAALLVGKTEKDTQLLLLGLHTVSCNSKTLRRVR